MIAPSVLALTLALAGSLDAHAGALSVEVKAGDFDRLDTPVAVVIPADRFAPPVLAALKLGPQTLRLTRDGDEGDMAAQAEFSGEDEANVSVSFLLEGATPARTGRRYRLASAEVTRSTSPWSIDERSPGIWELKNRERSVFRYNAVPAGHPNHASILRRDAYIHPAFSPSGALVTGDFSRLHPHHRGFFLAHTKTQVGSLHPDFWNFQNGSGRIVSEGLTTHAVGPVSAMFRTRHRWEAGGGVVLRETWDVEAHDIPGAKYWLFDLTSTQRAEATPLELLPYRYGGMAYRGAETFEKGPLDVLTSEGHHRVDGDQKPARWVDLTGPVEGGSMPYAGAMICDHPGNTNHPTVARIHPTTLPFFSYTPNHDARVVIRADAPTVFRYRILIHDGHPDPVLDERIWRDFSDPPTLTVAADPA
ncbi:PmoA family protein [Isosphaeraceae bacterium EP7]